MKTKILIALFSITLLSSCSNTWDGVGADLENVGKKMQGEDQQQHQVGY